MKTGTFPTPKETHRTRCPIVLILDCGAFFLNVTTYEKKTGFLLIEVFRKAKV